MFLQGNLQSVFDALYELGVIDPVLEMNWDEALDDMSGHNGLLDRAIQKANESQGCFEVLRDELEKFDDQTLSYLAMEVARELADFHAREQLH